MASSLSGEEMPAEVVSFDVRSSLDLDDARSSCILIILFFKHNVLEMIR